METRSFECMKCHKRATASFGTPTCPKCRMTMANATGRPLHTFECLRCHKRKRAALAGTLMCPSCGLSMAKVN